MPSHLRKLPFVGIALVLALLLSAYTMAPHRSAQTARAARPLTSSTVHFVQTTTSANTSGDSTFINNSATNNQPNATLFVTQRVGSTPNHVPIGVWYTGTQWAIFNEDKSNMPLNVAFNVLVVPIGAGGGLAFSQTAAPYNISGDTTFLNNAFTNGTPWAQLLITQNYNPVRVYNPHNVGVRYNVVRREWGIFNEDGTSMISGASFNVMIGASASGGGTALLLTATASITVGQSALINNSLINSDPSAIVFVTHNYNPGGGLNGIINDYGIEVWYDSFPLPAPNEWAVYNDDYKPTVPHLGLSIGTSFNIVAFS